MCNLIPFPQNNPAARNTFSCGQSRQAVSMYHTNNPVRMDKAAVVLNTPQIPLVKTRFMEYINGEENCYGNNVIVAVMCYTGYNMEDAVLINEAAVKRGLFSTTYYTTYETHEEKVVGSDGKTESEKLFSNIEKTPNVIGTKPGYEYQHLDDYGLVKEGTEVHDKMIMVGMTTMIDKKTGLRKDESKTPKKGQLGIVDKSFVTEGEEGQRIAKVRVREIRLPAIADKMASRSGQKGTIGMVVAEADMPFTSSGMIPDIVVNPHAIPSRMTVGQFVECITGKACALTGHFGDGTAFQASGVAQYAEILMAHRFHSSGNEILYDGMNGGQLEAEIFMGPTYYLRLKHMVKDKINYRPQGPRTALTRQPVSGRANDGGLRIGEMERDVLISHGSNNMLTESMMERSDKYYMAVCNKTGLIAVYNPDKNIFLSPMADGPLKFVGSLAENNLTVDNISRHGRSFSIVRIPYSLKLMIQELQTINVVMRIITDDNIDQIENMTFSKNMNILLNKKGEINIREYTTGLQNLAKKGKFAYVVPEKEEEEENKFQPVSPDYPQPVSPDYPQPVSPDYPQPVSPDYPDSPSASNQDEREGEDDIFFPKSPEDSPPNSFQPRSPDYPPPDDVFATPLLSKRGGIAGQENVKQYQLGEYVSLNSYQGADNLWQIENLGDEFVTVKKHGGGPGDIQVVEPFSLSPPQPYTPSPIVNSMMPQNIMSAPHLVGGESKPQGTNIFLINGDNNKVDDIGGVRKKSGGDLPLANTPVVIEGGKNTGPSTESNSKKEEESFSIFDTMSNFLVKKV
jgi:hypothetical protein